MLRRSHAPALLLFAASRLILFACRSRPPMVAGGASHCRQLPYDGLAHMIDALH